MKPTPLLALPMSAAAMIRPQQASSRCCFSLINNDTIGGILREAQTGDLVFGGPFQPTTLCLEQSSGIISDTRGNRCSVGEPGHQFKCRPGAPAPSEFRLEHNLDTSSKLLTYDGGNAAFVACSAGFSHDGGHTVYSSSKAMSSNCQEVALIAIDQTSGCSAPVVQPAPAPTAIRTTRTTVVGFTSTPSVRSHQVLGSASTASSKAAANATLVSGSVGATSVPSSVANATTFTVSRTTLVPSSTSNSSAIATASCAVADSAPSIAPIKIGFPTQDGISDTSANASITPTDNTIFQYRIPSSFVPAAGRLCALQFRLPFCSTLPPGYPCFNFSGSEQELLSNSGMVISVTDGAGSIPWNNSALQQVYPGETPIFGTFDCHALPVEYGGDRKISWLASSVNQFALSFLQAGVGSASEYADGINRILRLESSRKRRKTKDASPAASPVFPPGCQTKDRERGIGIHPRHQEQVRGEDAAGREQARRPLQREADGHHEHSHAIARLQPHGGGTVAEDDGADGAGLEADLLGQAEEGVGRQVEAQVRDDEATRDDGFLGGAAAAPSYASAKTAAAAAAAAAEADAGGEQGHEGRAQGHEGQARELGHGLPRDGTGGEEGSQNAGEDDGHEVGER
ncbi:uncharacterized protein PG986_007983 [Apiospora aurea]|uniref:Ubiquitin 3 binding protein But2 C-terminal domain-containing protein n=1 Tax=Apiospora aurea TaxID=335848 RepID=A0ABR1QE51_9PEZI